MKKIFKYELSPVPGSQMIQLPFDYKIVCAKVQHSSIVLYAIVSPEHGLQNVAIDLIMTGSEIWHEGDYIDTLMLDEGNFVLHLFKREL